jgi:hypothetical protein
MKERRGRESNGEDERKKERKKCKSRYVCSGNRLRALPT